MSELSRAKLICMASRIGWPAVLLRSYAFSVLTSMFSSTLKSAVTFIVTSQHAPCLPSDRAPVSRPWVWLAELYLGRKGWGPRRFFHVRTVDVWSGCTLAQSRVCQRSHSERMRLRSPRLQAAWCLHWRPAMGIVGGRQDNNYAPRQWGSVHQRGHLFKINPSSPHSGGFHISTFQLLRIVWGPVRVLDPAWRDV